MIPSLYLRLGGAPGVAAIVDNAVDRHAANPVLAPRCVGQDLPQLKTLGVTFLSARSGGPLPDAVHDGCTPTAGTRLSEAETAAVIGDVAAALIEQGVGATEAGELISLIYASRREALPGLDGPDTTQRRSKQ